MTLCVRPLGIERNVLSDWHETVEFEYEDKQRNNNNINNNNKCDTSAWTL